MNAHPSKFNECSPNFGWYDYLPTQKQNITHCLPIYPSTYTLLTHISRYLPVAHPSHLSQPKLMECATWRTETPTWHKSDVKWNQADLQSHRLYQKTYLESPPPPLVHFPPKLPTNVPPSYRLPSAWLPHQMLHHHH